MKSEFDEAYKNLNLKQKKAVDTIDGPVLVIAGPGSGKTQILSLRVANILKKTDTRASNILCLTFTDSASANMRERLAKFIGREAYKVHIATFHSFATDIISRYPEYFYKGASFLPADELTQFEVLEEIFRDLPHDNPLSSEHPEQGFVYLKDTRNTISHLKRAGVTPEEFLEILEHNEESLVWMRLLVAEAFGERLSMAILPSVEKCADLIAVHKSKKFPVDYFKPLAKLVSDSLMRAAKEARSENSTKPLTAWKEKWIRKNDEGNLDLKDGIYGEKMRALQAVYKIYIEQMRSLGYFDFDDMILDVIEAAKKHKALRFELQEMYQYVLVDEFQDTNDVQLRLVKIITDAPNNEGKPNVMVVGDDDQAVYRFQGADVSNVLNFETLFGKPEIIVLTDNYRSTKNILDVARHIILKGNERLEKLKPELTKELISVAKMQGEVTSKMLPSPTHQYAWVAKEVRRKIDEGVLPKNIALISRTHRVLEEIVPFLHEAGIPVSYEREQNVLEEPHIRELVVIARFVTSLSSKKKREADEYLPEILSFPWWGIEREEIWKISVSADNEGGKEKLWMDIMLAHKNKKISDIAHFLLKLSGLALREPLPYVLDEMIGSNSKKGFVSPFRKYYFNDLSLAKDKVVYLTFLSSLRTFVEALREYRRGKRLMLSHLVSFVDLHEKHEVLVSDQSPFASSVDSVVLLTAHKAKGLEFDTVFVLSCQEEVWAGRGRGSYLPFPMNMPIAPSGDTDDDRLRLFYVAITRAKKNLYLLSYEMNDKGKNSSRLGILGNDAINADVARALEPSAIVSDMPDVHHVLVSAWEAYNRPPYISDEMAILKKLVEDYAMSVTHLNNFLDVSKGGPRVFLEQNLLQFPQAKIPSGSFGTAMHSAIENMYSHIKTEGKQPAISKILEWFEKALSFERLGDKDFKLYLKKGQSALKEYISQKKSEFTKDSLNEVNFRNQGVQIGDARLSGKIDKMIKDSNGDYIVYDFKTGKAKGDWETGDPQEKIKLYRYRRQLLFYKILVENSREFGSKKVSQGVLQFLEPLRGKIVDLSLVYDQEEVERLKLIIQAVFKKIIALDFPDTAKYPPNLAGIKAFEDDLLSY